MGIMFRMDDSFAHTPRESEGRVCRTSNCGLYAFDGDDFCAKCSDEIDAARRFVIFGASGDDRPRTRRLVPRRL
jgi:hypothetical protein